MSRLSAKIHAAVDALGNPVRLLQTAGQASGYGQANALIEGFNSDFVVADRGYDSNQFIEIIELSGATAIIPPRHNPIRTSRTKLPRHATTRGNHHLAQVIENTP